MSTVPVAATAPRMPYWQIPSHLGAPIPATHTPPALHTPASSATGTPLPASAPASPLPAWLVPSSHNPELPGAQYVPNFEHDAAALGAAGNAGSPRGHELAIAAAVAIVLTLAVHLWRKHHHAG